jgi:hypothetical protein
LRFLRQNGSFEPESSISAKAHFLPGHLAQRPSSASFDGVADVAMAIKEHGMANKRGRDSGNGQFIPIDKAKKNPGTTTVETIPPPKKPTKPKGK